MLQQLELGLEYYPSKGSDPCEEFFASIGSWRNYLRTYAIYEGLIGAAVGLHRAKASKGTDIKIPRSSRKTDGSFWLKFFEPEVSRPEKKDPEQPEKKSEKPKKYTPISNFSVQDVERAWENGLRRAIRLAAFAGMWYQENDDPLDSYSDEESLLILRTALCSNLLETRKTTPPS